MKKKVQNTTLKYHTKIQKFKYFKQSLISLEKLCRKKINVENIEQGFLAWNTTFLVRKYFFPLPSTSISFRTNRLSSIYNLTV